MTDKILIDRDVVEQAMEALERNTIRMPVHLDYHFEAIKALRAALEQPQVKQEPVAWCHLHYYKDGSYFADCLQHYQDSYCKTPLYANQQPPRQPLTDDDIERIWEDWCRSWTGLEQFETIVRMVEKHHGITGEQE